MNILQQVIEEFDKNKQEYLSLQKNISTTVNGRCCHHKVVLLNIIQKYIPIDIYLEIGVHNGTSMSYIVNQNIKPIKCIGIDLFENTIGRYKNDKLAITKSRENIQKNNKSNSEIILIKGNSFNEETIDKVKSILDDNMVDLLFIDGDHSYNGIKNDFLKYTTIVRKNGIIIIDDYEPKYPDILKFVYDFIKLNPLFNILGVFENNELLIQKL